MTRRTVPAEASPRRGHQGTTRRAAVVRGVKDLSADLKVAGRQWYRDRTFEMGAALAFYAVFVIAPFLMLTIAVAGLVLSGSAAQAEVFRHLRITLGSTVAGAMEALLRPAPSGGAGAFPTWVSVVALLVGAMGFFGQLQQSLNAIWKVQPKAGRGVWGVVKDRGWSFLMILAVGVLLLAFLVFHAVLAVGVDRLFPSGALPGGVPLWRVLNWVVAFGFFTLLFALVYKTLPDVRLAWGDVWGGAALTALLFLLGNVLIALYLRASGVGSAYGAAGSAVVFLLWVFYSAQLFLFGAEFTQVLAQKAGRPRPPTPNAERLPD